MSDLTEMPNFFDNMPIDNIAEIMSKLKHRDAIKMRRTCRGMNDIFKGYRLMLDGPQCDASIKYINNTLELEICCGGRTRIIPLDKWKFEFKNATCHKLEIFTDSCVPDNFIKKVLCCSKIYECEYKGFQISEAWLEGLSSFVGVKLDVSVKKWDEKMEGTPQLKIVDIKDRINGLEEIVEVSRTTPELTFSINLDDFERTINSFKNIPSESVYIDYWWINIENVPEWRNPKSIVDRFIDEIERISQTGIDWRCEDSGFPLSYLLRIVEYGT